MTGRLDLAPTDDERLLREVTRRALGDAAPNRRLTSAAAGDSPPEMWDLACGLGWPGLLIPEAKGGLELPLASAAIVAEEVGRNLFCGPFAATAILAPTLFEDQDGLLAAIADNKVAVALAQGPASIGPSALSGRWDLVEHPRMAAYLLAVNASPEGLDAALAELEPGGCRITDLQPFDVTCPVARVELDRAPILASRHVTGTEVDDLLRPFHVVTAAELVGVARSALERATAFAKERQQFGVAIGSFQAIKHKLADGYVQVESGALAVRQAALDGRTDSALAARSLASEAALKVAGDCVQVHGGIGFSWECDAHLYLKRARRLVMSLARPAELRRKVADRLVARVLSEHGAVPAQ